ncbi:MAG: rhodanese-like domain-containing protein, partial [Pseudomonadota bacterium]
MNYKNPQYLVETDWLEAHLDQAGLRVFDVTGMLTAKLENVAEERHYDQGHIPGAIFFDVASAKGELSDPANDLPWMWPTQVHFEQVMSCYGVTQESHVVLYAATPRPNIDNGMMWCTRAWWTMHHLGVRCSILNGGWERWVTEERPVSTETATWSAASFKASGDGRSAVADKNAVLAATETPDQVRIVDALATSSFAGEGKALYGPRKGHITGAVSV